MIIENLSQVRETIQDARLKKAAINPIEAFQLIAVTKNHDVAAMREAIDAGVTAVGENRVQEARQKAAVLERTVKWHLIGHLQTNKVKQAVELFDLIHSVDSAKLAAQIDHAAAAMGKIQDILLQVNVAKEESKFGIYREDLDALLQVVNKLDNVRLCGLMSIAPHYENPETARPIFREMFMLFHALQAANPDGAAIRWLSMGMSNDYEIAIEEGSNMVRIGTGIFGHRQY